MIVNKEKFKLGVTEILMLLAACVYMVGIRTWFAVCPVMSETVMSCHWAGEVLKALSIVLLVADVIHIICPDHKIKLGMDIPLLGICIVMIIIPGNVINICQMADMSCRHNTQPWTIIIGCLMAVFTIADMILCASSISRKKHERKADA